MLDEFFIIYSNNSFISDPFNLLIICDEIHSSLHKRYKDLFSFHIPIFNDIIRLTEINDPEKGRAHRDKMARLTGKEHFTDYFATSYEAVYGYRNGYCEKNYYGCRAANSIDSKALLKEHELPTDIQLKCYQCNQLRFTSLLSRLVRGEYEKLISSYFTLIESQAKGIKIKLTPFLCSSIYLNRLFHFAYRFRKSLSNFDTN
jgi:hypothetical protein